MTNRPVRRPWWVRRIVRTPWAPLLRETERSVQREAFKSMPKR